MHIDDYLQNLREGARSAAALADDATRDIAERLSTALEPSARLTLERVLTDACEEISSQLAPSSVAVRVRDGEINFHSSRVPEAGSEPTVPLPPAPPAPPEDEGDGSTARFSLRLPQPLKDRVDEAAAEQGVSTNVWITQALGSALDRPTAPPPPNPPRFGFGDLGGRAVRGWVR